MPTDLASLSAAALLAIPPHEPERLFAADADAAKKQYRKLTQRWHPDRCRDPLATDVFAWIERLYDAATKKLAAGTWTIPGLVTWEATNGSRYEMRYLKKHTLEIGDMYVANNAVAFVVPNANTDLVERAQRAFDGFHYASSKMQSEVSRYLPSLPLAGRFATADAQVMVMQKTPDVLLLRDVLAHFGGRVDARHVAWIVSSALNLACYFNYAGIVHNAISADSLFISPPYHSGVLLGGWWYAARQGEKMTAAPARTVEYGPHGLLATKVADIRTDLELIRALGRELLGDVTGSKLARDNAAPEPMIRWLRQPASDNAIGDYQEWQSRVLKESFGERRFVEFNVAQRDIYKGE